MDSSAPTPTTLERLKGCLAVGLQHASSQVALSFPYGKLTLWVIWIGWMNPMSQSPLTLHLNYLELSPGGTLGWRGLVSIHSVASQCKWGCMELRWSCIGVVYVVLRVVLQLYSSCDEVAMELHRGCIGIMWVRRCCMVGSPKCYMRDGEDVLELYRHSMEFVEEL